MQHGIEDILFEVVIRVEGVYSCFTLGWVWFFHSGDLGMTLAANEAVEKRVQELADAVLD